MNTLKARCSRPSRCAFIFSMVPSILVKGVDQYNVLLGHGVTSNCSKNVFREFRHPICKSQGFPPKMRWSKS